MLYIVEGPDCSGKTTYAKKLAQENKGVYFHQTCTKLLTPGLLDYQLNVLENVKIGLAEGQTWILDRGWPSDHVYAPIIRPKADKITPRLRAITESFQPQYIFMEREDVEEAHEKEKSKAHPYPKKIFKRIVRGYRDLVDELLSDFWLKDRVLVVKWSGKEVPVTSE